MKVCNAFPFLVILKVQNKLIVIWNFAQNIYEVKSTRLIEDMLHDLCIIHIYIALEQIFNIVAQPYSVDIFLS